MNANRCFGLRNQRLELPNGRNRRATWPFYDTPEAEVAAWDLACGKPEEGLKLLTEQIAANPHMIISFTVLRNYYFSEGDIQKALKAEMDGISAITYQQPTHAAS